MRYTCDSCNRENKKTEKQITKSMAEGKADAQLFQLLSSLLQQARFYSFESHVSVSFINFITC